VRRLLTALAVVAGLVTASCSSDDAASTPNATAVTTDPSQTTSTTQRPLPEPARYQPVAGEPVPDAKQLAADTLQRIGTYPDGGGTPDAARQRLAELAASPSVADQAGPLLAPGASSSVEIVYPQLGGLSETEASVMVVFRHRLLADGARERVVTRTADVRLTAGPGGWSVTQLASTGGDAVEPAALSPAAEAVLASDAIDLPDSARWDIEAGRVEDRVLQLLVDLAADHTLSVTVLSTGHPTNVFETETVSNHTRGRGVDIWAVDGQPVISQRDPAGPLRALVADLLARGVTELGSPVDVDGAGGASFANTVHQDHLHLAFDGS
jgi:hypothetical protein